MWSPACISVCTHICICIYTYTCILFFETFGNNVKTLYAFTPECFRVYSLQTRTVFYKTTVQLILVQFSLSTQAISSICQRSPNELYKIQARHTLCIWGSHFSVSFRGEHLPSLCFCWPIHFEDHRPFIFLTIRFRSCIFGRNIKGPGCILLRAQMRRLCSQWILLVSMLTSITWIRWCSQDFSTMK